MSFEFKALNNQCPVRPMVATFVIVTKLSEWPLMLNTLCLASFTIKPTTADDLDSISLKQPQ